MIPLGTPACIDCRDDWSLLISIYCILWLWYSFGRSFAVPRISYCLSLQRRIEWLMSKAFGKSILYMPTTYCPALEACKIVSFWARSAVWVNLCFLKPCCKSFSNFQTVKYEYILMYISAKLLPAKPHCCYESSEKRFVIIFAERWNSTHFTIKIETKIWKSAPFVLFRDIQNVQASLYIDLLRLVGVQAAASMLLCFTYIRPQMQNLHHGNHYWKQCRCSGAFARVWKLRFLVLQYCRWFGWISLLQGLPTASFWES